MREIPAELFGLRHALRTARRPRLRSCRPASRRHRLGEPDRHHSTTNIPGAGGLVNKQTKGRSVRCVPILQPLAPVLERLTADREPDTGLVTGPRGGVLTTATVRDATTWDSIFTELGLPNLTRHGLRHTGATWFADAGIPLHVLEKIPGHQSLETTLGYLHPDHRHLAAAAAAAAAQANTFLTGWSPAEEARAKTPRRNGPAR